MYNNYQMPYGRVNRPQFRPNNGNRIIGGGFAAPFLLGGITGAVLSPYFYRPYPVYYPPYQPYPYYRPY